MSNSDATTAQIIGAYHRELIAQGLPAELTADLVRHAGFQIHTNDGIGVEPITATGETK